MFAMIFVPNTWKSSKIVNNLAPTASTSVQPSLQLLKIGENLNASSVITFIRYSMVGFHVAMIFSI